MSDLLNEVITEILLLGEADKADKKPAAKKRVLKPGESKKHPGYYHRGAGYYSNVSKNGLVTHKTDDTGKMVVLSPEEKVAKNKGTQQPEEPQRIGSRTGQSMRWDTERGNISREQVVANIDNKIKSLKDETKIEALTKLQQALVSGDAKTLKTLIADMGLVIGNSHALKARKLSTQDITNKDKELTRQIYDLAKEIGVEIPGAPGDDAEEPTSSSEEFKPQSIFKQDQINQLDVKDVDGGVEVEGVKLEEITDEAKITEIENNIVNRAKQTRGGEFTPEHEYRIRRYVRARVEANNHNIKYLKDVAYRGGKLPAHQFSGEEGSKRIVKRTTPLLEQHISDEKNRVEAKSALDVMATAKTPKEFNAAYERFSKAVRGTALQKNMKYIAETLTALRVTSLGGTALIPQSDSFPLADVISVKRSPITGEVDIEQILVDVDEEQEVTTAGSVKVGKGAGSGNKPKIENSRFDTGDVDGVDCSEVVDDLGSMTSISSRNAIFTPTKDGQPTPEAKKQIMGWLKKYGPMIRAYYGIKDKMGDKELYEFLSYGKEMVCVDGKVAPTPDGSKSKPFKQAEKPNGGQWRAWSVVGRLTEVVHNRTVRQQYYHTIRYNGVVKTADGIRRLSKMAFQPFKNEAKMKGSEGSTRPDQAQNGFTIPATIEETANGNPCTQ
jgi:hypothetical protein